MDTEKVITSEVTERVVTIEKLLEIYNIDLEVWEIEKKVVNTWEVGAKDPNGVIVTTPLFQVKLWLKKKQVAYDLNVLRTQFLEDLLEDARPEPYFIPGFEEVIKKYK